MSVQIQATDIVGPFASLATSSGNITTGNNFLGSGNTAADYRIGTDSNFTDGGQIAMKGSSVGNSVIMLAGGLQSGLFTSTGLNDTVIGESTPRSGAFSLLKVATQTPASASAAGAAGTIAWDASFLYVCVAINSWKRVGISSW